MATTKWMGLWAQERPAFYAGQVIKKADIPKYTRIVLRYNKYYEKDSSRPRFVYCFADSDGYAEKCIPIEYEEESGDGAYLGDDGNYYTASGDRLYTHDEVQYAINRASEDGARGYGYGDNIVSDYL